MTRRIVALALGLLVIWPAAPARAAWQGVAAGSATARSTALAAPSPIVATCVSLTAKVMLAWPVSATSWADGYEVRWGTASGTYTTGSATTTALTFTTPSLPLGTYYFVVRATKQSWISANSNEVSKSVVSVLGVGTCV
jgi:hypothetical protein